MKHVNTGQILKNMLQHNQNIRHWPHVMNRLFVFTSIVVLTDWLLLLDDQDH